MNMSYRFEMTPKLVKYLQIIERVRETVRLTVLPPATAEVLRFQANIRSTHYSTLIEGNRLTLEETENVVQRGGQFPGRERDVHEVEQYYQALQQMDNWVEGGQKITEERIRKLHAILYSSRRARPTPYRDGQNVIREDGGNIVYMPPEAEDVPDLMKELVAWIHKQQGEMPIPVIAGVAHYQFETIHPFYDGNGRTGRILYILYLILNELIDVPILYLSSYIIANKPEYYRLLNQTNRSGKWEEWIMFMLKAVESTSKDTITRITNIKDQLDSTIIKVQEKAPKLYRKELVELLFEQPYSKIEFVVNKLGVERKAASRYLKELEAIGIVESQKVGRETLYINRELIEILKQ